MEKYSSIKIIQENVKICKKCNLCTTRKNAVPGKGKHDGDLIFVGEAPGKSEDLQGEPFVGRAGGLLNEMFFSIGLSREEIFIANILKCRPPQNRDPLASEVAQCLPYLERQIQHINPMIIIAVGRVAAQNLLQTDKTMSQLRGRIHSFGAKKTPLVVIYHPAYLLRSPSQKFKAWEDLTLAKQAISKF